MRRQHSSSSLFFLPFFITIFLLLSGQNSHCALDTISTTATSENKNSYQKIRHLLQQALLEKANNQQQQAIRDALLAQQQLTQSTTQKSTQSSITSFKQAAAYAEITSLLQTPETPTSPNQQPQPTPAPKNPVPSPDQQLEAQKNHYQQEITDNLDNNNARTQLQQLQQYQAAATTSKRNQTEQQLLLRADQAWNVDSSTATTKQTFSHKPQLSLDQNQTPLETKLRSWRITSVDFDNLPFPDVLLYLRQQTALLDPEGIGINFFLKLPLQKKRTPPSPSPSDEVTPSSPPSSVEDLPTNAATENEENKAEKENQQQPDPIKNLEEKYHIPHITLQLSDIPLIDLLHYLERAGHLKLRIDPYAVCFLPLVNDESLPTTMISRHYKIDPSLFPAGENFTSSDNTPSAREILLHDGINFPEGAIAHYEPNSGDLLVHNTPENLLLIQKLLQRLSSSPSSEVIITTRFLEIDQTELEELGLQALLHPTSLGSSDLHGAGVANLAPGAELGNLENETTSLSATTPGSEILPAPTSVSPSVDSLESPNPLISSSLPLTNSSLNQALMSIVGVYNSNDFQLILRALQAHQGVEMMAAPQVTTRSGHLASIEMTHEFTYPTHYAPPQIPETTMNTFRRVNFFKEMPPTITPNFPDQWGHQNVGVTLEALPFIHDDHKTVTLSLHPRIIDFEGFLNYGTPINTIGYHFSATQGSMVPRAEKVTINDIKQPLFNLREITTSVTLHDQETLVLGGLIREEENAVHSKIPLLGDIPMVGKLFRAKKAQKTKKNLIIFVTPTIITR